MKRILLEGPAVEPVLLADAKAHMRVDGNAEDDQIASLIAAARVAIESEIRRVLIAQRWRGITELWPARGILLPVVPVLSVEVVCAIDGEGAATILDQSDYELDLADFSLRLENRPSGAVHYEIDFTAGYGPSGASVPQPLKQAIRLLVTHWFENRAAAVVGEAASEIQPGWRELVAPYRRMALC
jgi:uncharacterized phiE125 gp8 family phage protein